VELDLQVFLDAGCSAAEREAFGIDLTPPPPPFTWVIGGRPAEPASWADVAGNAPVTKSSRVGHRRPGKARVIGATILAALGDGAMTCAQIAEAVGMNTERVRGNLHSMAKIGLVWNEATRTGTLWRAAE
jgi:hypothetical protein